MAVRVHPARPAVVDCRAKSHTSSILSPEFGRAPFFNGDLNVVDVGHFENI